MEVWVWLKWLTVNLTYGNATSTDPAPTHVLPGSLLITLQWMPLFTHSCASRRDVAQSCRDEERCVCTEDKLLKRSSAPPAHPLSLRAECLWSTLPNCGQHETCWVPSKRGYSFSSYSLKFSSFSCGHVNGLTLNLDVGEDTLLTRRVFFFIFILFFHL